MEAFILGLGLVFGMLYSAMPDVAPETQPANAVQVQMGDEKPLVSRTNDINHGELVVQRNSYRGNRTCILVQGSQQNQCIESVNRVMGIPVLVDSWQKDGAWHLRYADGFQCRITTQELACEFDDK